MILGLYSFVLPNSYEPSMARFLHLVLVNHLTLAWVYLESSKFTFISRANIERENGKHSFWLGNLHLFLLRIICIFCICAVFYVLFSWDSYIAQPGFKPLILLPQTLECWNYKHVPLHLACFNKNFLKICYNFVPLFLMVTIVIITSFAYYS